MAKNLKQLAALLVNPFIRGRLDHTIEAVAHDSRKVVPGTLFFCLTGAHVDGHNFIAEAVRSGAVAVVVERDVPDIPASSATIIKVKDTREAMQAIVPCYFDYPGYKLRMIGVTGTNGKTTTTYLIRDILRQAGHKVGLIGTIQTLIDDKALPIKNTTPDVIELQSTLAEMVSSGMEYAVMEVSSHALALNRVAGCEFDVGIFTNMTQDHLDFHQTFENYIDAKAKLFRGLNQSTNRKTGKTAVINLDDSAGATMAENSDCPIISYAVQHQDAVLTAGKVDVKAAGSSFSIIGPFGDMELTLTITGMFNVYNVLAAVGAALAEKVPPDTIKAALEGFASVPGRFELVKAGQPFTVIVDYAHTPDGLENVLKTAQQFVQGKIIVVFGCGGDRDRTKRPIMGKIAVQYGDVVLATSDNPRSEDPHKILLDIEAGIKEALSADNPGKRYEVIPDRRQAITRAIQLAGPTDVVLIAGKGHETYQILKEKTIDFDDRQVAREVIKEMMENG